MQLKLDFDYDLPRTVDREPGDGAIERDVGVQEKTRETPLSPDPLELRAQHLAELAAQNRFPDIPRRTYERPQAPERPTGEAERHLRPRHHLPPTFNLRLHPEEKQLLGEVARFRVLAVTDIARTVYAGDLATLRSHLKFLR